MVHIKGKTLSHKVYELDIDVGSTIADLKNKFSDLIDHKISEYEYKLIHLGKVINDDEIISDSYDNKLFIIMTTKRKENIPIPKQVEKLEEKESNNLSATFSSINLNNQPNNLALLGYLLNGQAPIMPLNNNMNNVNQLISQLGSMLNQNFDDNNDEDEDDEEHDNNNYNNEENVEDDNADEDDNNENDNEDQDEDEEKEEVEENHINNNIIVNNNINNQEYNKKLVGNFNNEEIDEINELVTMGFDYYEVIQFYEASGKNKELAIELLMNGT